MQRVILLIPDAGDEPVNDIHPDDDANRRALAAYVRERTVQPIAMHADNDDGAIEAYFASATASYSVVGIAGDDR